MEYRPPTWSNFNNSHLLEVAEDGTIKPTEEYQTFANEKNQDLEQSGINARLIWDNITSSFVLHFTDCN